MGQLIFDRFTFEELFHSEGLFKLDQQFLQQLHAVDPACHANLLKYRNRTADFSALEVSELLLAVAPILEDFIASLFHVEEEVALAQARTTSHNPLATFKKFYVLRRAKKAATNPAAIANFAELNQWLTEELNAFSIQSEDKELVVALLGNHYVTEPDCFSDQIEKLTQWCAHALITPEAMQIVANWTSFHLPKRIDPANLVHNQPLANDPLDRIGLPDDKLRLRDGFGLTDPRMNARQVQDEINYCIYCHDHEGDLCSKGFPAKKGDPTQGFKKNALDVTLTGCPLEEKISEMHALKRDGFTIGALAMIMVDNPMCPATGHRICNDCMKACIYQKQDPVNIPQIETRVLDDVLSLPWGVEIYDLLTRWNPLRQSQWMMKPYNGLKILIAGMGPAGFTLAHHLLLEGFAVVGFDGLKIEPLPKTLITQPIERFDDLKESLDERIMMGFGGVAEYGITVRWDKNFLKLIYLSLSRRPYFQVFGGVRFGGTIHVDDAWEMGFDHLALAVGAGLPKALPVPGSLAIGMRQANDFLMALQLGNAAKSSSLTNLQIRLPAVVIGGGLTGVDTATEVQAYYITQVEKVLFRHEKLVQKYGENYVFDKLDIASRNILNEFLEHGKRVREERERAKRHNEKPNFIKLIREWGGVTIVYRRTMQESPAYINNHEELEKALEEGIYYLETLEPVSVELDSFGHANKLICRHRVEPGEEQTADAAEIAIPARAILVATGTQPNTAYEFEHRGTFARVGLQYQHYEENDDELQVAHGVEHCKDPNFGPFTSYQRNKHRVSLIGDTHPVFHGNVVKAIASGMRTYPKILTLLQDKINQHNTPDDYTQFARKMDELFTARLTQLERKTANVIELTIKAPLAVKHFQPGQSYRLQNFETTAIIKENTLLQTEPLALVAADVDREQHTLKFIIIEKGASSKLCATFRIGEPLSLMGPTGVKAKIAREHETVLIIGNQVSIALLNSYGKALRHAGNRVIYLGLFDNEKEVYCQDRLENVTDLIIWATKSGKLINPTRPQDYSVKSDNAVETLLQYVTGTLDSNKSQPEIPLSDVDRIYLVGQTQLLRQFQQARLDELKKYLVKEPAVFGSVYSTMQCMLKGVCAQCLQWQIDPETGKRTKAVFACSWPDQPLELIDVTNLEERQQQNHLSEVISNLWVDYLFEKTTLMREELM